MNLHLTTENEAFAKATYEAIKDSMKEHPVEGYTTVSYAGIKTGYHRFTTNNDGSPRYVTFGDMLNTIVYGGDKKFYFTRDDWDFENTGKCVTYNDIDIDHPYLELHYCGTGFNVKDENGIGIGETPYFVTPNDMFRRRWRIVYIENETIL
jgi:hypothetical protein